MNLTHRPLPAFLLLLLLTLTTAQPNTSGALPSSAADGVDPITIIRPRPSILEYLQSTGDHKVLTALFTTLGSDADNLAEPAARFTVFAPTDAAFATLARRITRGRQITDDPGDIIRVLTVVAARLESIPGFVGVRGILTYHLLPLAAPYAELENQVRIRTQSGDDLVFENGQIEDLDPSAGNITAWPKNVFVKNGWVNVVPQVLLPFDASQAIENVGGLIDISLPVQGSPSPSPTRPAPSSPKPVAVPAPVESEGEGDEEVTGDGEDVDGGIEGEGPIDVVIGEGTEPSASPEEEDDGPACFPADATVSLPGGRSVRMEHLEAGMHVMHGIDESSPVFLFSHRSAHERAAFVRLHTVSGHSVTLTPGHYVRMGGKLVAAREVKVGNVVHTIRGDSKVAKIERIVSRGMYAPHAVGGGDLVVDGVLVSGYSTALHPTVAHAVLSPVRWLVRSTGVVEPFGSLFYSGAKMLQGVLPAGGNVH